MLTYQEARAALKSLSDEEKAESSRMADAIEKSIVSEEVNLDPQYLRHPDGSLEIQEVSFVRALRDGGKGHA